MLYALGTDISLRLIINQGITLFAFNQSLYIGSKHKAHHSKQYYHNQHNNKRNRPAWKPSWLNLRLVLADSHIPQTVQDSELVVPNGEIDQSGDTGGKEPEGLEEGTGVVDDVDGGGVEFLDQDEVGGGVGQDFGDVGWGV